MDDKGILSAIINGFTESTKTFREINKGNMAAVKEESKAVFETAAAPNADLIKMIETKGFWNKIKMIFNSIIENVDANSAKERIRSTEIQNHDSYRAILEAQRINRQKVSAY